MAQKYFRSHRRAGKGVSGMNKSLLGVPNHICWCCGQDRKACYTCGDYHHFVVKEDLTQCVELKAEVERLKGELAELKDKTKYFIMPIEPHEPIDQIRVCDECVLSRGPMCLDRSYCKHNEAGKTWKKRL